MQKSTRNTVIFSIVVVLLYISILFIYLYIKSSKEKIITPYQEFSYLEKNMKKIILVDYKKDEKPVSIYPGGIDKTYKNINCKINNAYLSMEAYIENDKSLIPGDEDVYFGIDGAEKNGKGGHIRMLVDNIKVPNNPNIYLYNMKNMSFTTLDNKISNNEDIMSEIGNTLNTQIVAYISANKKDRVLKNMILYYTCENCEKGDINCRLEYLPDNK